MRNAVDAEEVRGGILGERKDVGIGGNWVVVVPGRGTLRLMAMDEEKWFIDARRRSSFHDNADWSMQAPTN